MKNTKEKLNMEIPELKKEFLESIALRSAVNAATQTRSVPVYSELICWKELDSKEIARKKKGKKREVILFWEECLKKYSRKPDNNEKEASFVDKVCSMQKEINVKYKEYFHGEGIRIAQCQKSLAVYLKWLWCLGWIDYEPTVCPIDRNVLKKCYKSLKKGEDKTDTEDIEIINKIFDDGGWGQINNKEEYEKLIKIINKIATKERKSVAVWELTHFNSVLSIEK